MIQVAQVTTYHSPSKISNKKAKKDYDNAFLDYKLTYVTSYLRLIKSKIIDLKSQNDNLYIVFKISFLFALRY